MIEDELHDLGANAVIYDIDLVSWSFPAMIKTAESILENGRAFDTSLNNCMSIEDILRLIPEEY